TVVLTSGFILVCLGIHRHYVKTAKLLQRLDDILTTVPMPEPTGPAPVVDPNAPTAGFLVNGYHGLGLHAVLGRPRLFRRPLKNFVCVSVGVIDSSRFKGVDEVENLRRSTEEALAKYVSFARSMGVYAESHYVLGTDTIDEVEGLCARVAESYPRSVFFSGKL